jgi:hypothetical protein
VSFADVWRESIDAELVGLNVRVISQPHLIVSKQHSARQIDTDDIKALQGLSI